MFAMVLGKVKVLNKNSNLKSKFPKYLPSISS